MKVYAFKSAKDADVYGFTSDDTGGNLPEELGPWQVQDHGAAMSARNVAQNELLLQTLQTEGYYIVHTDRPEWPG